MNCGKRETESKLQILTPIILEGILGIPIWIGIICLGLTDKHFGWGAFLLAGLATWPSREYYKRIKEAVAKLRGREFSPNNSGEQDS